MLSRFTTHCPQGHELVQNDAGIRTKKIPPSEVLDVQSVGWCDVCIEPFMEEERWSCTECLYDCCWRCHDEGREAYIVQLDFTSGGLEGQTVFGTLDVLKSKIPESALKDSDENVTASKAIKTFDCDLCDVTFGVDKLELQEIRNSSVVTFSRSTGGLQKVQFSYTNPNIEKDYEEYGAAVEQFAALAMFDDSVPDDLKKSNANWFGLRASWIESVDSFETYGTMTFRRFGLIEVPGFGMPKEKTGKMLDLLQEIAKDKRQIINPMRRKTSPDGGSIFSACLPSILKTTPAGGSAVPPLRITHKTQEEKKANEILDVLSTHEAELDAYNELVSGKIHHKDLIFASRLSCLAYMIDPVPFGAFFPADREKYLLDPVWLNFIEHIEQNEGRELLRQWLGQNETRGRKLEEHAHEVFLAKFISTFFVSDDTQPNFGYSKALNAPGGPLESLGLEYAKIFPDRPGKEGALQFGGTEGFVAISQNIEQEGGDICIVFQGTNEVRDLWVSMNGFTTPFEPLSDGANAGKMACLQGRLVADNDTTTNEKNLLRVHLGFYNAFLKLRDPIDKFVRTILAKIPKDKNVRIVVTGHSLGGALASMCTAYFLQLFDPELKDRASASYPVIPDEFTMTDSDRLRILCVTFGAPKIGNNQFVDWMDTHRFVQPMSEGKTVRFKMLRMVDVMDPIVTLPPSSGGFSYIHTTMRGATVAKHGGMIFISREGAKKYDDTTRGLGVIFAKGQKAIQNHDLFLYLHKCLHFAWVYNNVCEGEEWEEDPLVRAFGAPNYRYDKFVKSPEFRTLF